MTVMIAAPAAPVNISPTVNIYSTVVPLLIMAVASIYMDTILPTNGMTRHSSEPLQPLNVANLQNIQNNVKRPNAGSMALKPAKKALTESASLKSSVKENGAHVKQKLPTVTPHISQQSKSAAPQPAASQPAASQPAASQPAASQPAGSQPNNLQTLPTDSHHMKTHAFPQLRPASDPVLGTINNIMLVFGAERRQSNEGKLTMADLVGRCEKAVKPEDVTILKKKIASKTEELVPVAGWYKRVIADPKACSNMCVKCLKEFTYYIAASYNYIWTLKAVVLMKESGQSLQNAIDKVNQKMNKPLSLGEVNKAVEENQWFVKSATILAKTKLAKETSPSSSGIPKHKSPRSGGSPKLKSSISSGSPKLRSSKSSGIPKPSSSKGGVSEWASGMPKLRPSFNAGGLKAV